MSAVVPVAGDQVAERLTERLAAFRLPTAAAEMVPRLLAAGQADALPIVLEVCDLERIAVSGGCSGCGERLTCHRARRLPPLTRRGCRLPWRAS